MKTTSKRPRDVIGNAIAVAKIATGESKEKSPKKSKRAKGAKALPPEKRSEIAKKAAKKRWDK